ncbi:D-alanyl-D-alanine carboxypeptidase family protein [Anaeromicropila herbilytica]|uniref:Peptidase S11 D-alanyl-D-alanine carboxypeptidase A N-terminal domain-containing protein n=1 Tax=Anaeromicropila herbilytica TaxID=2785025 RepID=A0A7R7EMF6_9FIRM|nr:serine hydrolase [Anaeromicropila herbilytica]BCN31202.1 hypothetical protein bsdtb5_24970 [Anaeromicropila herbilytica]
MKNRRLILTIVTLSIMLLFVACNKKDDALLSYQKENNNVVMDYELSSSGITSSDSFSKNLCVIPVDYKSQQDNILTSESSLIVNSTENQVIYSKNIYEKLYPASITKIVTALVTLKYGNLDDMVTISHNASHITEPGAKLCGFKEGDQIKLKDLLTSLLVYSGNDAGVAVAEHIGGSVEKFADMMNEEVKKLGAVNSHFVNPHGLHDDNHYTTAYDLYLVFHELIKNDVFLDIIHKERFKAEYYDVKGNKVSKVFVSTDRYLKGTATVKAGITVIGGKTGTTEKAGSCLILYSKDKKENDYISVVLKAASGNDLFYQMSHLLDLIPVK